MIKQVLVYRRDLKMRKGKIAAQCAHASMKVFFDRMHKAKNFTLDGNSMVHECGYSEHGDITVYGGKIRILHPTPEMEYWMDHAFAKIVLSVENLEELQEIYDLATQAEIPCAMIVDSGKTEFHGVPTCTTVAVGPASSEIIDLITGPQGAVKTKLA